MVHVDLAIRIVIIVLGIYALLIVVRAVLSWLPHEPDGPVSRAEHVVVILTDPYLRGFRYLLPVSRFGWSARRDFSSLLGLVVLFIAMQVLLRI
jgi:YggT family protein